MAPREALPRISLDVFSLKDIRKSLNFILFFELVNFIFKNPSKSAENFILLLYKKTQKFILSFFSSNYY